MRSMRRTGWTIWTVTLALAGLSLACDSAPAAPAAKADPAKTPATKAPPAKAPEPEPKPDKAEEPAPTPEPTPDPGAAEAAPDPEASPAEAETAPEAAPEPAPEAQPDNIRDPSLLPPGTPAGHVSAFERLPVAKSDKAPVGGVGANGIHLDELEIGRGWHKSRCDLVGNAFTVGIDDKVNVCMRVIHPREEELLLIYWMKDGKQSQRSKVKVNPRLAADHRRPQGQLAGDHQDRGRRRARRGLVHDQVSQPLSVTCAS